MVFLILYLNTMVTAVVVGMAWSGIKDESLAMKIWLILFMFVLSPITVVFTANDIIEYIRDEGNA